MNLSRLLENISTENIQGTTDIEINKIAYSSLNVEKGDLFVCIKGYSSDGHDYIEDAISKGAVAIIVSKDVNVDNVTVIKVENSRKALSFISANYYNNPSKKLRIIGITGTNGKTTTTYLIKHILENVGYKVGLIGTNQNMIGDEIIETQRTTPESLELNELFSKMVEKEVNYVVMEVSSHSLFLDRVAEIDFEVGVITNITQDHLDFHETMENYAMAKGILFEKSKKSILNVDDEYYPMIKNFPKKEVITYGIDKECDIKAENLFLNAKGVSFDVVTSSECYKVNMGIPGKFSVYNALLATAVATSLEIPAGFIRMSIKNQKGVKGRCELVEVPADYSVIIDYAHSPDGLYNILSTINEFKIGRLITVFGCGGDRDKTKRPKMAKVATQNSDVVIITSDNPRTENPSEIIKDILVGIEGTTTECHAIENRKEAIHLALEIAKKDDIVLLAGKGHETYQILNTGKIHFDERDVIKEYFER